MNRRVNGLAFAVLLGLVIALWMRFEPLSPDESGYRLEMDLVSTGSGGTWVQYDFGKGWNYRQRQTVWTEQSAQPRTWTVALPPGVFHALAIVPPEKVHQELAGARILAPDGTIVAKIPPVRESPGRNKLVLRLAQPIELMAPDAKSWAASGLDFVLGTGVVWLIGYLLHRRVGDALQVRLQTAAGTFVTWIAAHPRLTLCGVATAAVAVSCYPVVFCGKSFVSPNNGVLCLYDVHPTLPGAPAQPIDAWTGSDINATMWEHLPYSIIAHDAVFKDHEIPMWNRYGTCGITMIGQGMSMLGDPLYLMTVAADGATWAWDVRFLLSKLLFCFGLGLIVWRSVRHLGVAILLTFSCAFIGYFSFRFNHPAFFGLCYAPWMLLCWLSIAEATTLRRASWWALGLIAANWVEFNSGTAKESAMLMVGMNGAGALAILFQSQPWAVRCKKLALAAASCAGFLAISAPLWMTFFDALKSAFTIYDVPHSNQLTPGLLIGLFDDLFFRQLMKDELHVDPALNFLVLLGLCWAIVDLRAWVGSPIGKAALAVGGIAVGIVFAIVPPWLVDRVPLLQNVIHVDDTFICVAVVPLFVVAGFGLRTCLQTMASLTEWRSKWKATLFIVAGLTALYFGTAQALPASADFALQLRQPPIFSPFFLGYALALLTAVAVLPLLTNGLIMRRGPFATLALALLLGLGILHFRHGQWLQTKFDAYVVNPQQRVDLQARSPAVQFVRERQSEPGRTMAFGAILRPGFNIVYGLERPDGADAVELLPLAEWYEAAGLEAYSMWWPTVTKANARASQRVYDAMNVRYYFGSAADAAQPAAGLEKIASADLDVFESKSAWPRAFFTDRLNQYSNIRSLIHWVKDGDGRPFAAAKAGDSYLPTISADQASRQIVPARDYRLTSNTTSFTIDAPTAGIAVLNESFVPNNFRVYLNGQRIPCFRVNHIFKAIALPGPGTFQVKFVYWPYFFTTTLWVSLVGLIIVLMSAAALFFFPALLAAEFQTPPPPGTGRVRDA